MLDSIEAGSYPNLKDLKEAITATRAIGSLKNIPQPFSGCLDVLKQCLVLTKGHHSSGSRSLIYRAACWLDELMFKSSGA